MEIVIEALVWFLVEVVGSVIGELLLELGFETLASPFLKERDSNPILAAIGFVLLGALLGWVTTWSYPNRLIANPPVPGASLVLIPLLSGAAMQWFGAHQRKQKRETSWLATFWGGALLAFACALTRFILL